jgi:hypothetical protein
MDRLFEMLTDNLKGVYTKQIEYGKLLIKLYQHDKNNIERIKFSFTSEIEELIKER